MLTIGFNPSNLPSVQPWYRAGNLISNKYSPSYSRVTPFLWLIFTDKPEFLIRILPSLLTNGRLTAASFTYRKCTEMHIVNFICFAITAKFLCINFMLGDWWPDDFLAFAISSDIPGYVLHQYLVFQFLRVAKIQYTNKADNFG